VLAHLREHPLAHHRVDDPEDVPRLPSHFVARVAGDLLEGAIDLHNRTFRQTSEHRESGSSFEQDGEPLLTLSQLSIAGRLSRALVRLAHILFLPLRQ
jgi:hypothetical protein